MFEGVKGKVFLRFYQFIIISIQFENPAMYNIQSIKLIRAIHKEKFKDLLILKLTFCD